MSYSNKDEQGLLSHEEYELIKSAHHPALYGLDKDALRNLALRLESSRDKAQTLAHQKRREAKGTSGARGKSFPGTSDHPAKRKQIFAQALKRVKKERARLYHLEMRTKNIEAAHHALALRRAGKFVHHPETGPSANPGQKAKDIAPKRVRTPRSQVGSVIKANARAQAKRDGRT
jgi:hypothetical protein